MPSPLCNRALFISLSFLIAMLSSTQRVWCAGAVLASPGATPAIIEAELVLTEVSRQALGQTRVSVEASLVLARMEGLRAVEVRLVGVADDAGDLVLVPDDSPQDIALLRTKRLERGGQPPEDILAVILGKDGTRDLDGDGQLVLGTIRGTVGQEAMRRAVTARGMLEDGRIVMLPVTYRSSHSNPAPDERGGLQLDPNPTRGPVEMRFRLERRSHVTLAVYDARGRCVRTVLSAVRDVGEQVVTWDGQDEARHPVERGTYYIRLTAGGLNIKQQLTKLR